MKIYAGRGFNELDKFVGKDCWVKAEVRGGIHKNPIYMKILYDEGIRGIASYIYLHCSSLMVDENYEGYLTTYEIEEVVREDLSHTHATPCNDATICKPVECLNTEELIQQIANNSGMSDLYTRLWHISMSVEPY